MANLVSLALATFGFTLSFGAWHYYHHEPDCTPIMKLSLYGAATTGVYIMSYYFDKIHV